MVIYLVKNRINGKEYVGQTTTALRQQWYHHYYRCNHICPRDGVSLLHNALRKYGKDAFDIYELQECKTVEELNTAEDKWIKKLNTKAPNGYNLRDGGNNGKLSEITKQKLRKVPHTADWNNKVSKSRMGQKANANQLKGLKIGWELAKQRVAECKIKFRGEGNPNCKLSINDVLEIRRLRATGLTQQKVADIFNVGQTTISEIVLRKAWTNI